MNANELANALEAIGTTEVVMCDAATMLRQQQAEIEELKKFNKAILKKGGFPYPLLTDEEILELTKDSSIFEYREFDDDMVRFARAILRKAHAK